MTTSGKKPELKVPTYIPPDPIVLPADKDKLARWQGDHAALLARLQESFAEMWLINDARWIDNGPEGAGVKPSRFRVVGELIRGAVEHLEELQR